VPPLFFWRSTMTIHFDHAFHIGEKHLRQGKPCQDYALSGTLSECISYAIVSDGCSSGGLTDIGSRLVVLATERAIRESVLYGELSAQRINVARDAYIETFRRTLGLKADDMYATSLWALMTEDTVLAHAAGDGVVALVRKSVDYPYTFELVWDNNTPYYPSYHLAGQDNGFAHAHKDSGTPLTLTIEDTAPTGMGGIPDGSIRELTLKEGMAGITIDLSRSDPAFVTPVLGVALFSDGVSQVDGLETREVVKSLLAFKSTTGQFFTRRMNRFLQDVKRIGRGPIDDIAGAVIHIEP
jgi:hypothetical protein